MISGIYQLTFPDGSRYIGKSINIEERWSQHLDKMKKGTAAKNMQQAWNTYRNFDAEVIFECHPDHIDIMEECLIARLKPELNTTRPVDRLPGVYGDDFEKLIKYFRYSTESHITTLLDLDRRLDMAHKNIENLEEALEEIQQQRTREEIEADVNNRIESLARDCSELITENEVVSEENKKLRKSLQLANRSWWQKLFG